MMVIIPNPNDMIVLTKLQNRILKENNQTALFKNYPLWIPLPSFKTSRNLKETAKSIKSIKLLSLEADYSISVQIELTDNSLIKTSLLLIKVSHNIDQLKKINSQDLFPMSLKVFRVGVSKTLSSNSSGISNDIWVKLKS